VIYVEQENGKVELIEVLEVNKHESRKTQNVQREGSRETVW
jgi:hypothetical protein